jgi:hypothetical protein
MAENTRAEAKPHRLAYSRDTSPHFSAIETAALLSVPAGAVWLLSIFVRWLLS